jgi:hypothetical protein
MASLFTNIRHSSQPDIRCVSTAGRSTSTATPGGLAAVDFDVLHKHQQLELWESAILAGRDPLHVHPIQAITAFEKGGNLPLDKQSSRYEDAQGTERVPDFWPDRSWDEPTAQMGRNESEELLRRIKAARDKPPKAVSRQKKPRSAAILTPVEDAIVRLNASAFRTAFSGEETDSDAF